MNPNKPKNHLNKYGGHPYLTFNPNILEMNMEELFAEYCSDDRIYFKGKKFFVFMCPTSIKSERTVPTKRTKIGGGQIITKVESTSISESSKTLLAAVSCLDKREVIKDLSISTSNDRLIINDKYAVDSGTRYGGIYKICLSLAKNIGRREGEGAHQLALDAMGYVADAIFDEIFDSDWESTIVNSKEHISYISKLATDRGRDYLKLERAKKRVTEFFHGMEDINEISKDATVYHQDNYEGVSEDLIEGNADDSIIVSKIDEDDMEPYWSYESVDEFTKSDDSGNTIKPHKYELDVLEKFLTRKIPEVYTDMKEAVDNDYSSSILFDDIIEFGSIGKIASYVFSDHPRDDTKRMEYLAELKKEKDKMYNTLRGRVITEGKRGRYITEKVFGNRRPKTKEITALLDFMRLHVDSL